MDESISESRVKECWDANAESWAEQVRKGWDVYREYWNNPAFLDFIGDLAGQTVLDAGCGEGYNTRILARRGARMTGSDISARMIELARIEERREPLGIRYEVASFSDLAGFGEASFEAAVSFMALMDGPDFEGAAHELFRVLRPGGTLAFSIIHPCFMTRGFGWVEDEQGRARHLTVAGYFDDTPWIERWKFSRAKESQQVAPFAIPRFDRTLSHYLNGVIAAGFVLQRIGEPRVSEEACRRHVSFRRWRDHAPLFLYVKAAKPR